MPQTVTSTVLVDRVRSVSTMFCKDARAAFPSVLKWKHTGRSHTLVNLVRNSKSNSNFSIE